MVRERLVCRTIVDGHSSYENIHSVDVSCRFLSSLLSISPEKVDFYAEKVGGLLLWLLPELTGHVSSFFSFMALQVLGQELQPLYEKLVLSNVSSQSLSLELSLAEPFSLCEAAGSSSSALTKVPFRFGWSSH